MNSCQAAVWRKANNSAALHFLSESNAAIDSARMIVAVPMWRQLRWDTPTEAQAHYELIMMKVEEK